MGEKGPRGANGSTGSTGPIGPYGQTICHYPYSTTTTTDLANLPLPSIAVATGWNTYRNSNTYPSYIAWNAGQQLESTKVYVSLIEQTGVNIHTFLSMLRQGDYVTIQSKINHLILQKWNINAVPVLHDNCIELGVSLVDGSAIEDPSVILIFAYNGNAIANALDERIETLEATVAMLAARLAAAGIA
jgi:hypothetical protein